MFKAVETVTTSSPVRASSVKASFNFCKRSDAFCLAAHEGKIRDFLEFSKVWRVNYRIEALSAQRRAERWGFLNQQYFKGQHLKILKRQGCG
jgi:hypothetical protein